MKPRSYKFYFAASLVSLMAIVIAITISESVSAELRSLVGARPMVTRTWDGGGATNNWSEAANWSGDVAPGSADVVVFNSTSTKNSVIDTDFSTSTFQIEVGYTGTISQGTSNLTVDGHFYQSAGTFTGGSGVLTLNFTLYLDGGTFNAPTGTLNFPSSVTVQPGATFNHNGGTIVFTGTTYQTFFVPHNAVFPLNNVVLNKTHSTSLHFLSSGTVTVLGTLTLTEGGMDLNSGGTKIDVQGELIMAPTFDGGPGASPITLQISGPSARTVSFPVGAQMLPLIVNAPNVTVNTSGTGTFTFSSVDLQSAASFTNGSVHAVFNGPFTLGPTAFTQGTGNASFESSYTQDGGTFTSGSGGLDFKAPFALNSGTFVAPAGSMSFFSHIHVLPGATFNPNGGTVVFTGISAQQFLRIPTTFTLNNVIVSRAHDTELFWFNSPTTLVVEGALTLTDGRLERNSTGSTIEARGDISVGATFDGGIGGNPALVLISGSANQTYTNSGGVNPGATWTINKSAGTLTAASSLILQTGQTLNLTRGTLYLNENSNLTAGAINIGTGGRLVNESSTTITLGGNLSNSGIIDLNGGGATCPGTDSILIRSTSATQRTWTGGRNRLVDVDVQNMGGTGTKTVYSGTNSGGNNATWVFDDGCPPPLTVTPSMVDVPTGANQIFTAGGGFAPYTFSLAVNNSGGTIGPTTGSYTAGSTIGVSDTVRVTDAFGGTADATVTVIGVPSRLGFIVQPANAAASQIIAPPVKVAVQDSLGNTVTNSTAAVTISIQDNPGGGTLTGTLTRNAVNGIATFDDLSINNTGTGYTLRAAAGSLTDATSNAFNIIAGAPSRLAFLVQPSATVQNQNIQPAVQVAVQDQFGNTVATATNPIFIRLGSNPWFGTLSGTLSATPVNGIAVFDSLSIDVFGPFYNLVAQTSFLPSASSEFFSVLPSLVVVNTNNAGVGSLRQAILNANAHPGADTITFNIPGTGPYVINSLTPLDIGGTLTIDGTSQPGYVGAPLVEVRGTPTFASGFAIYGDSCAIQGLAITGFGNAMGGAGILVLGANTSLINNYIGLDPDGTTARGNEYGVVVAHTATNTFVGPTAGQSANLRNIISGNVYSIAVLGTGNSAQGNYIGTNAAGTSAVPNTYGVSVYGSGNIVRDNVISGNLGHGIFFVDLHTGNALAERNRIGLAATTLTPIPNGGSGIIIPYQITRGVRLSQNRIFGNNDFGIRLGTLYPGAPALPNDPQDPDNGANGLQNYPRIGTAFTVNGTTQISGSLNSTPSSTFHLEFFSSPSCDSSGHGEGETYIGSSSVITDAGGIASFISPAISLPVVVPDGRFITATATDAAGNTSEFSRCAVVAPRAQILGAVLTGGGLPIPNVQVRLTNSQDPTLTRTTVSNSTGNFSYSFLPPADYTMTVIHPNLTFAPPSRFYPNLTANQSNQNFVSGSPQRFTLRGRARTTANGSNISERDGKSSLMPPVPAGGFPLLGVTFNVSGPGINRNLTNDSFGDYRFDGLPPGDYVVTPSKPNYVFNPPLANVNIGSNQTVDFDGTSLGLSTLAGRIVYDSRGSIMAMNADGSGVVTLLNSDRTGARLMPRLSENGQRVVLVSRSTTNTQNRIVAINADGTGNDLLLTQNSRLSSPMYSPNRNLVAFHNEGGNLVIMNADGSGTQSTVANCADPDWSPDGTQIVCLENAGAGTHVKTVNLNTTMQTTLDSTSGRKFSPRWSPDGSKIGFIRRQAGTPSTHSIVVKNLSGSTDTFMSGTNNLFETLSWSPDGARLLITRDTTAGAGLNRPPGGNKQLVTVQSNDGQNMLVIVDGFDGDRVDWGLSNSFATPASPTTTVINAGAVSISFPSTTGTGGFTTVTPIEPNSAGAAPNGFVLGNFAFEINTTAGYTPPVTVCIDFDTPGVQLRLLPPGPPALMHNENGVLVNITTSYDDTTNILCGQANSFSPFVIAEQIDTTLPSITGLVIDSNGDPMSGVVMNLTGAETDATQTDSSGLFTFVNLIGGANYSVQPQSVGYLFTEYSTDFLGVTGDSTVVFTGTAGAYQIAGRVADPLGVALAGVTITLDGAATDEVVTDAAGNYLFTGLPADGSFFISASRGGLSFTPNQHSVGSLTRDSGGVDFTGFAPTAASVSVGGRVLTAEGQGIGRARVSIAGADGNIQTALTNPFGYYRFDQVEVGGTYLVSVDARSYQFENPTRTVSVADELTDVDFIALPRQIAMIKASDLFSILSR